ncbi:HPP family protein [Pararobbsia silviterrae]|uniref:HPP family protein n=1 Tax=Pararobbsia silviterrae TaxID=1792498 RepID=A0A494Y6Y9_9BURK|nr:HPP family protein [Pararobbsia silviterrae]RKP58404.1 HPP family protein [Pararobbsia silviterrae]
MRVWLSSFSPAPMTVRGAERVRACVGALIGIACVGITMRVLLANHPAAVPMLVAPMGASAVLLFGVPASPLAQPWSIIGGNLVAATIGVACAQLIPDPLLAAALAVALALAGMFALRCVHPPSGAVALTAVLGGHDIHALGFGFVVSPILFQSMALLGAALVYHAATGHRYPHANHAAQALGMARGSDAQGLPPMPLTRGDLDAALARQRELLDIAPDDLETLFRDVQLHAYARSFATLTCAEIMSRDVIVVGPRMPATLALERLTRHRVKALPVSDTAGRLAGIVTRADLMQPDARELGATRIVRLMRRWLASAEPAAKRTPGCTVGDVMTTEVRAVSIDAPVSELVPLFADHGHHHVPVVDRDRRVVGVITPTDMIRGVYRQAGLPERSIEHGGARHAA